MCWRYICVLFRGEFWDEAEEISGILSSIPSILFDCGINSNVPLIFLKTKKIVQKSLLKSFPWMVANINVLFYWLLFCFHTHTQNKNKK